MISRSRVLHTVLLAAALLTPVALSPSAFAQEHEGQATGEAHGEAHGIDAKTLASQFLNFGVLLFVLIKFGGGAVTKALGARHQQLKSSIEDSARVRQEAEARLAEQVRRVGNLEQEIAALRATMKQDAELEATRLVALAEEKAKRVQAETTFLLDQQVKQAELAFRAEVATAAVRIAEELLRRSVEPQDEQRLARTFVSDVTGSPVS